MHDVDESTADSAKGGTWMHSHEIRVLDLLHDLREGFVVQGADGRILLSNPAAEAILGLTVKQMAGRSSVDPRWQSIHEDGTPFPGAEHPAMVTLATGEPMRDVVMGVRKPNGDLTWILINTDPIWTEGAQTPYAVLSLFNDVTSLREAQAAVLQQGKIAQDLLDALMDPVVTLRPTFDEQGRTDDFVHVAANTAACQWSSTPREELLGMSLTSLFPPHMAHELVESYRHVVESGQPLSLEEFAFEQEHVDGRELFFDVRVVPIDLGVCVTWRDVTGRAVEKRSLILSEEHYRLLAENSSDVVLHVRHGVVAWVSPSLTRLLGWSAQDVVGGDVLRLVAPSDRDTARENLVSVEEGRPGVLRLRALTPSGSTHWVSIHAVPFLDSAGEPDGISATVRLIDEEIAVEDKLFDQATHDHLTGLLNRAAVTDALKTSLAQARRDDTEIAVLFCDIDDFKRVNDTAGHDAGDEVLRALADRIRQVVRHDDLVARFGGDEILVVLNGVSDVADARRVADKILTEARVPMENDAVDQRVTLSIGVTTVSPREKFDAVITRADEAMYLAKEAGKDHIVVVPAPTAQA